MLAYVPHMLSVQKTLRFPWWLDVARKISFKWDNGFLVVEESPQGISVRASNTEIEFSLRSIAVKGLYQGLREYEEAPKSQYKNVYIDLAFPISGADRPVEVVFTRQSDTHIGGFGLSYTPLGSAGSYLTIYPPPGALYEYAVVSSDKIMLYMLKRRQIYVMEENGKRSIIMV